MTTTDIQPRKNQARQQQEGIFAALLAELRADVEEANVAFLHASPPKQPNHGRDAAPATAQAVVQLPLPGLGLLPSVVEADAADMDPDGAQGERWTPGEVGRHEKRPSARRRNERLYALKARRDAWRRPPSLVDVVKDAFGQDGLEDSGATKCARLSLRVQLNHELVVVRRRFPAEWDGAGSDEERQYNGGRGWELELREQEGGVDEPFDPALVVEVDRVRVVKPAGVIAHLRAVDRALAGDA